MSGNVRVSNISPRQARAVRALAIGLSQYDAADMAGVNEKTVRRWKTSEDFRYALRQETDAMLAASSARLAGLVAIALDVLEEILTGDTSPGVRRLAAMAVLEMRLKYHDAADVADRLDALERIVYGE